MSEPRITPSINWPLIERAILSPHTIATHRVLIGAVERAVERTAALVLLQMSSERRNEHVRGLVIGTWFARNFSCRVVILRNEYGFDEARVNVTDGHGGTGELAHFMALGLELILTKTLRAPLLQPNAHWFLNPGDESG